MNYSKRLVELMIDEDMINNILDDADPNFYFFEEDKFVKITDSGICSEDLFDDFSFEYDFDLDEDKPLFLASNFIKYDDYYAPLFFIPILYSDGVIKRNNNCDILFNELLSLDFAENNINFLNFTKNDDPQTFYENLKKIDGCELSEDIFVVDFYFDSLVNYLDLNRNWKTLDEKINIVKSGNKFIYYPRRSAYYLILGPAISNRKILYISNNLNSYDLNLFNILSLKLGREVYNKNIFDLNIEDERPILVMSYALCCLLTDEKFESLFDLIVIDDNLNLKDENYISLLLRSKTNAIFKNKPETKKEIKNTEFNVKDDYVNINEGKIYGEGEFGASKSDLRHSAPLYDDRYFRE